MTANPPIVRFGAQAEVTEYPCAYCWPRIAMSALRDQLNRPICCNCAQDRHRTLQMPRFVADHISEALQ